MILMKWMTGNNPAVYCLPIGFSFHRSSDDVKVRKKAPVSRPTRRKASYMESSDDDEEQNDNDEDSENDDDEEEEDGETDLSFKKKQTRPDDIEALFEEPLEPSIEKVLYKAILYRDFMPL